MMCDYGHLHTHSEYSTLDGMSKVRELIETAKALGQTFIGITDHGTMSGLYEAQKIGDELGVQVVLGCEFYYEREGDGENGHLLVLAKNDTGLRNMYKMHEIASKDNFYKKPRINWTILKDHHEGLIVTSACLGSAFNQYIMNGDVSNATNWARKFQEVFGEDFYIELQPNEIPEQHLCNTTGIRIAKQLGIELVATNDVHYTYSEDCYPHEVLLAMQFNNKMSSDKRFKFSTNDFWLKSSDEMKQTFQGIDEEIVAQALRNTTVIASKCSARINKGNFLPKFYDVPDGETPRSLLAKKIMTGLKQRGLSRDKDFVGHVQNEIDVIDRNGYSDYFLIVQDFVTSAKSRGELVGEGRGSGAGSKVAYTTRITEIPPHEYDLLFERFMADGREPDFDVDFSDQQAVFKDLQGKYGVSNVSRIIAFGKMTPKAVTRKVLNAYEVPEYVIKSITKLIPDHTKDVFEAVAEVPELSAHIETYAEQFDVIRRLQNVVSHTSQHAGGILIYPNLGEHLPLGWDRGREIHVAGFDKYMLEELGHFKFDVLGLETLPIVYNTINAIKKHDKSFDITRIDLEDERVYAMLQKGDVSGVFQINNQSTKVIQQRPRNFRDLIAINALIRPGVGDWDEYLARRNGSDYAIYEPRKPYMRETVGTMTYQEQFLLDCHHIAGWGIAYADKHVRKNKNIREDTELRDKFITDATERGHEEEVCVAIWDEIMDAVSGGYSFNKSHSASYAMLTYQTAYLKCLYPNEFYASLMSGTKTDGEGQQEIAGYIAECKTRGIAVLPPDINDSDNHFLATPDGIRYRLTTIKHVGDSAIDHIRSLRPIASFEDFMARRDTKYAKKNVIIALIKAGAFDFDTPDRAHVMWQFEMSRRTKTQIKNNVQFPQIAFDDLTKMEWEKEVFGMYLSLHPMERFGFQSLESFKDNEQALQGGEVVSIYEFHPQKNPAKPKMAFVTINTLFGIIKVVVFASIWADAETQEVLREGNIVLLKGKKSGKDLLLDKAEVLT